MVDVLKDRLAEISEIELLSGGHDPNSEGQMCVMEAVAYVAGEDWSDSPACASPVIGAFMRSWNDSLDTEGRQKLKPYIPRLVGTAASEEVEEARAFMAGDWQVRVFTPAWLELAGVTEAAAALRALPPLMDLAAVEDATPAIQDAKKAGAAAWDAAWDAAGAAAGAAAWDAARAAARAAAWDAAWDAAGAAAWDAAWAAARAAARDAARDAAGAAARAAAWDAARDAARDAAWAAARAAARAAAWDAARDAARAALEPTKVELQASAFELLDRMIAVGDSK